MNEYYVIVREQEADYDDVEHVWVVEVGKEGFPPHAREEFNTRKEAQRRARKLRKSLP